MQRELVSSSIWKILLCVDFRGYKVIRMTDIRTRVMEF